jgi:hypothetical protein
MEAIFGLLGVVVGAGLAGAFEYAFRKRSETGEARAAARLLLHDLRDLVWVEPELEKDEAERRRYDFSQALQTWREHRGVLARILTNDEWEEVSAAVELLGGVHGSDPGAIGRPTRHGRESGWTPEMFERGIIELLQDRVDKAVMALQRTAFGRREARAVERERRQLLAEAQEQDTSGDTGESV